MCHLLNIGIDNSTIKYAVINQSNDFSMSYYFFTISIKLLEVQSFPDVNCFLCNQSPIHALHLLVGKLLDFQIDCAHIPFSYVCLNLIARDAWFNFY